MSTVARMSGSSKTSNITPKLELISCTSNPVGTLFAVWHNSRNSRRVNASVIQKIFNSNTISDDIFDEVEYLIDTYPEYNPGRPTALDNAIEIIGTVVELVVKLDVPASEFISYSFVVENANVAWREQLVRARDLSVWMQTSRTQDSAVIDCTRISSIDDAGEEAVQIYNDAVQNIRDTYKKLVQLGVPSEDIRLLPQSMLHRVMFGGNLRSILRMINKRTSWIAQSSLWSSIISDMLKILSDTLGTWILKYVQDKGVVIRDGKIIEYKYVNECIDRMTGKDIIPVDCRYLSYTNQCMPEHTDIEFYDRMKKLFINMWDDEMLNILGWDRSNPSKIGPYDRPYSWFKKNNKLDMIKGLSHENK